MDKRIQFRRTRYVHQSTGQFLIRLFAWVLDLHLLAVLIVPVFWLVNGLGYHTDDSFFGNHFLRTGDILAFAVVLAYFTFFEQSKWRGTVGKMFFRLTISNQHGDRITPGKSLLRNLLKCVSILTVLGVWMIDLTKHHQSLHDLLSGTRVSRK